MIAIYEPIYLPGQILTEPAFRPLQLEDNSYADWREFRIIVDMYRRGLHREQRFTGLFSPKFGLKTGLTGQRFIDFIQDNADADVCFVNPFPQLAYISYNVWMQGEACHPGLTERAQKLLDASGIDINIANVPRHGPNLLCYCNYWVGTENFWDQYVGDILLPIAECLEQNSTSDTYRMVLDGTDHTAQSPFLPFIVERLFSTYLSISPRPISMRCFQIDPAKLCLHPFEYEIVKHRQNNIDDAPEASSLISKDEMELLTRLWQVYNLEYFTNHKHPHISNDSSPKRS